MRLPPVPRLRIALPVVSPTTKANGGVVGIVFMMFCVMSWNSYAKPAGVYRGAARVTVPDIDIPQSTPVAGNQSADASSAAPAGPAIEGKLALRLKHSLMLDAKSRLQTIPDYIATFLRQERVDGKLLPKESTEMKVRHAPFSVYMKWNEGSDVGREVLFVKGQNDDRMMVKKGGQVGELLPTFKLDPSGDLAMKESRHPVTESGILNLVEKILKYGDRDLKLDEGVNCKFLPDQKLDGRICHVVRTDYDCAEVDADYRCSIVFIDKETAFPLCVKNYGWLEGRAATSAPNDKLTDETLVEFYAFTGLRYQARLHEQDFSHANKEYRFHR